jgi:hypothetical protein
MFSTCGASMVASTRCEVLVNTRGSDQPVQSKAYGQLRSTGGVVVEVVSATDVAEGDGWTKLPTSPQATVAIARAATPADLRRIRHRVLTLH